MTFDLGWFKNPSNISQFLGEIFWEEPLFRHTYYRIGGPASLLVFPKSEADLQVLSRGLRETGAPWYVLGAGSNVLASDEGFRGVVIRLSRLDIKIEELDTEKLYLGAGVSVSTLLRQASVHGWGGLGFLTGIPGSVGGAVFMNAGTHLGETRDALYSVQAFDLRTGLGQVYGPPDLKFEYRKNLFLPKTSVVCSSVWMFKKSQPEQVKSELDLLLKRRKETQPIDLPSCGSVFKNPKASGKSAWQVVDELGLRGHRIGGAQFSEKHSNFIVNLGGALATDVRRLIDLAKEGALQKFGIVLEEEVKYLG